MDRTTVFGIFLLIMVVGMPLAFVVSWAILSRQVSEKGALAMQPVALGQPFELTVPAGPAFKLLLRYAVLGPGTAKNPLYGLAIHLELSRGRGGAGSGAAPFTLNEQVRIGKSEATAGTAPKVRVEWILGEHNSQVGGGPVETGATAPIAHVPAGEACVIRGRLEAAPGTEGRGFLLLAKPTKADPKPRAAKPESAPQVGPSLAGLIIGPIVVLGLACGSAFLGLVSCTETIDLLEGPGEPGVVVASERKKIGKSTYLLVDVRTDDGRMWTAQSDPDDVPLLPAGHRTKVFREGVSDPNVRYPTAFIAEERDSELSGNRIGRGVLLFLITPIILIGGSLACIADMRTYRRRRKAS